jgi:hypothetical protein
MLLALRAGNKKARSVAGFEFVDWFGDLSMGFERSRSQLSETSNTKSACNMSTIKGWYFPLQALFAKLTKFPKAQNNAKITLPQHS